MARFHPLTVTEIRRETRDAVAVTLAPRDWDLARFAFQPGQYLTFRRDFDGAEVRRSYSICAGPEEDCLRVGIKRVDGGAFSTWANTALRPGDVLEAMPPMGRFVAPDAPDGGTGRHLLFFAGGSGITPVLSLLKATLSGDTSSRAMLIYGNRSLGQIMFREEIEDLKNRYLGRLSVVHILETESDVPLFHGRIDGAKCVDLFRTLVDPVAADLVFVCGPAPMMDAVTSALAAHGVPSDRVKIERFLSNQPGRAATRAASSALASGAVACQATIVIEGVRHKVAIAPGQTVLDAAEAAGLAPPWSCRAGVCSTCRAHVSEGAVEMTANHALEDYEVAHGAILSCQAHPVSPQLVVHYDD